MQSAYASRYRSSWRRFPFSAYSVPPPAPTSPPIAAPVPAPVPPPAMAPPAAPTAAPPRAPITPSLTTSFVLSCGPATAAAWSLHAVIAVCVGCAGAVATGAGALAGAGAGAVARGAALARGGSWLRAAVRSSDLESVQFATTSPVTRATTMERTRPIVVSFQRFQPLLVMIRPPESCTAASRRAAAVPTFGPQSDDGTRPCATAWPASTQGGGVRTSLFRNFLHAD